MNDLQVPMPTMESVETVDVSWLHHSQKGQSRTQPRLPEGEATGFGCCLIIGSRADVKLTVPWF